MSATGASAVRATTYIERTPNAAPCAYGTNIVGTAALRTLSYFVSRATPATSTSRSLKIRNRCPTAGATPKMARAAVSLSTTTRGAAAESDASIARPATIGIPSVAK
jgi:hypothetical protein